MLPILCAMDLFGVHAYRGRWSRAHLRGPAAGRDRRHRRRRPRVRHAAGQRDPAAARRDRRRVRAQPVAAAHRTDRRRGSRRGDRRPGAAAGAFWGALSGFTSTLAHAGGPPFAVYMLPQKLDKTMLVGTSVVFFLVVNYVKLVPYYFLGQLNAGNLAASLVFAPLAPLGIWLGVWLHRRMSRAACSTASATRCCSRPASSSSTTRWPALTPPRRRPSPGGSAACAMMRAHRRRRSSATPMKQTFLDFEQPIAELQAKIDELRFVHEDSAVDISDEIARLHEEEPAADQGHLRQALVVADRAGRAPPAAAVHARLRRRHVQRLPRAARRPQRTPTTRRSSAASRASTASRAW